MFPVTVLRVFVYTYVYNRQNVGKAQKVCDKSAATVPHREEAGSKAKGREGPSTSRSQKFGEIDLFCLET